MPCLPYPIFLDEVARSPTFEYDFKMVDFMASSYGDLSDSFRSIFLQTEAWNARCKSRIA